MFDKYEDWMLIYNLLDDLEECFHLKSPHNNTSITLHICSKV